VVEGQKSVRGRYGNAACRAQRLSVTALNKRILRITNQEEQQASGEVK